MDSDLLPVEFTISIETFEINSFKVELSGSKLYYQNRGYSVCPEACVTPSNEEWKKFWHTADRIGLWEWKIDPLAFSIDGTSWSINIKYNDRQIKVEGSDSYPGSNNNLPSREFEEFLRAVSNLIGGRQFG